MNISVSFIGRISRSAEVIDTKNSKFLGFGVIVYESTKNGEQTQRWVTVTCNATTFENYAKHLVKGRFVQVRGIERVEAYINKAGKPCVNTKVWAEGLDLMPIPINRSEKTDAQNKVIADSATTSSDTSKESE